MKKLLVVLLSFGLIVALGAPASAVDVKFSGSYYVAGFYDNNPQLWNAAGANTFSRAAIYQQFRLQPEFIVAEGLKVTTRFDALEKQWGNTDYRSIAAADMDKTNSRKFTSNNVSNIQENIEFERAYVTFATAAGLFEVGYQDADQWGTQFGNSSSSRPRVKFATKVGPLTMLAIYEKVFEADQSNVAGYRGKVDADADNYFLAGIFNFKGGEAGLLYKYAVNNTNRCTAANFGTRVQGLVPYFKVTLGPVYLEGEAGYAFGKAAISDTPGVADVDFKQMAGYLNAKVNMGPAYFGAQVGWIQGDGDNANEINNTGMVNAGLEGGYGWNPTLMLNNVNTGTWEANANSTGNTYKSDKRGYFVYGIYGGVNPTPKLNLEAALNVVAYDKAKYFANVTIRNVAQAELVSDKIGTEIDLTATYQIYDNLSYMVGAAYLITGDAWKGNIGTTNEVSNNYLLVNKLALSF